MKPTELVDPDPRWQHFGTDRAALERKAASWPVGKAVPKGVADVLQVVRSLFVHSYFVYEFSLVATTWALLALEISLRDCLGAGDRRRFEQMIKDAVKCGLLHPDEALAIDAARNLRNGIIHGEMLVSTLTPGSTAEMLGATHEAISDLYERSAN